MIAIERMVQKIYPGKWAELEAIDKRYNAVEKSFRDFLPIRSASSP